MRRYDSLLRIVLLCLAPSSPKQKSPAAPSPPPIFGAPDLIPTSFTSPVPGKK
jgi:hypothetical protein